MSSDPALSPDTDPTNAAPCVRGTHLVGSVNLPDAESAFRAVGERLGDRMRRIPDGEVGERYYWIQFQTRRFDRMAGLSRLPVEPFLLRGEFDGRPFRLEADATTLEFPDLGYAAAALESYAAFARLREEGVLPAQARFQVSLPTPAAVTGAFVVPEDRAAFEPAYERALFGELERILAGIPHHDLAIQWDTAVEFGLLEGRIPAWFDDVLGGVIERAARQATAVPTEVEVGYHLCYGDVEEQHFVQPTDAGHLAAVTEGILAATDRPIDFIHLPIPIERDDPGYFAPLAALELPDETEIYLGLLHHEDGVEGAGRRVAAAATALPRFGVATECGFGRGPSERTAALLDLHADVTAPWPSPLQLDEEAFELLVTDELDRLPDEMVDGLENVVFVIEDRPEDGSLNLLGLYDGVALTERDRYGFGEMPDRIILYREPLLAISESEAELRDEIHVTLVHEIAHYYGIDDERLHELGWA